MAIAMVRNNHQVAGSRGSKRSFVPAPDDGSGIIPVTGPLNQYKPGPAPTHKGKNPPKIFILTMLTI